MEGRREAFQVLPGSVNPKSVQGLRGLLRSDPGLPPPRWTTLLPDSSGPVPFTRNIPLSTLHLTNSLSLALQLKWHFFKKVASPQMLCTTWYLSFIGSYQSLENIFNNTIICLMSPSPSDQELHGDKSLPNTLKEVAPASRVCFRSFYMTALQILSGYHHDYPKASSA